MPLVDRRRPYCRDADQLPVPNQTNLPCSPFVKSPASFPSTLIGWSPSGPGTTMTNLSMGPLMLPSTGSTLLSPRSISPSRR